MGSLQDHSGLLQHLCAGAQQWGLALKHSQHALCASAAVGCVHTVQQQAVSIEMASNVAGASMPQGMMLLAGSTTVYQVLPGAGEKKKQKLQVPRLVLLCRSFPSGTVEMLVQHVTCKGALGELPLMHAGLHLLHKFVRRGSGYRRYQILTHFHPFLTVIHQSSRLSYMYHLGIIYRYQAQCIGFWR